MRFISATVVFPVSSDPVPNGIVAIEENGAIAGIYNPVTGVSSGSAFSSFPEPGNVERLEGALCPGFINSHCHLELSHLKGKLNTGKGLPFFIRQILSMRDASKEEIDAAMKEADREMSHAGIVAVGDISNVNHSLEVKSSSLIRYHTFVEAFDFYDERADSEFEEKSSLLKEFRDRGLSASLVPHAPYTVSKRLLKRISAHAYSDGEALCIHNQETESENEMFLKGSGDMIDFLRKGIPAYADWKPSGFNSLPSVFAQLPNCNRIQFVHNTFTSENDIDWAHRYSDLSYWCFCPNANQFIENRLPDISLFVKKGCQITLGTDSYASNWSLSIVDEMKAIASQYPLIDLDEMLKWACLHPAKFFGWHNELGSLNVNRKPGLNLITGIDTETLSLTSSAAVRKIV